MIHITSPYSQNPLQPLEMKEASERWATVTPPGEGEAERAWHSVTLVEQYAERLAALRVYNGQRKGAFYMVYPAFAPASALVCLVPLWCRSHSCACRCGTAQNGST